MQHRIPVVQFSQGDQRVYIDGVDWTGRFDRMDVEMRNEYGAPSVRVTMEFHAELHQTVSAEQLRAAAIELHAMAEELERKGTF